MCPEIFVDDNTIVVRLKLEGITPEQFSPLAQIYYKAVSLILCSP